MLVRRYSEQEYRRAEKPEQLQDIVRTGLQKQSRLCFVRQSTLAAQACVITYSLVAKSGILCRICVFMVRLVSLVMDCGQAIKQIIQSGRSSFYCSSCQR